MANKPMDDEKHLAVQEALFAIWKDIKAAEDAGHSIARWTDDPYRNHLTNLFDAGHEHGIRSRDGEVERLTNLVDTLITLSGKEGESDDS